MFNRDVVRLGAIVWAAVGFAVGLTAFRSINADARVLFSVAWIGGPLAAALASVLLADRRDRTAGALLVVSVITPTFFAWPLNLPALVIGLALLATPVAVIGDTRVRR